MHFSITHALWQADYVASSPIKNRENTEKIDELCQKIEVMNTEDTVVIIIKVGFFLKNLNINFKSFLSVGAYGIWK